MLPIIKVHISNNSSLSCWAFPDHCPSEISSLNLQSFCISLPFRPVPPHTCSLGCKLFEGRGFNQKHLSFHGMFCVLNLTLTECRWSPRATHFNPSPPKGCLSKSGKCISHVWAAISINWVGSSCRQDNNKHVPKTYKVRETLYLKELHSQACKCVKIAEESKGCMLATV